MANEVNDTGCRMFAVETAKQIGLATGAVSAEQVIKDAKTILNFVSPQPSSLVGVAGNPVRSGH